MLFPRLSFPRLVPAVLFAAVSAVAQSPTNAVNVDQIITLEANLSSLNETPPILASPPPPSVPSAGFNAVSTATARIAIRFIGANSTNVNPVTGTPLPITGTTANVSRATVSVSMSSVFANSDTINTIRLERAPVTTGTGTTANPSVFDFTLPTATVNVGSGFQDNLLSHQFEVTNAAQLAILREVANNPDGFYINILTTAGPNGMVRGQLHRAGDSADEVTGNRLDVLTLLVVRMAYADGLITAAERDSYLAGLPPQPTANPTQPSGGSSGN